MRTISDIRKAFLDDPSTFGTVNFLTSHGGFRTLFDFLSSEWSDTTLREKKSILEILNRVVPVKELILAYKESYKHREDIVWAVEESLNRINYQIDSFGVGNRRNEDIEAGYNFVRVSNFISRQSYQRDWEQAIQDSSSN